MILGAQLYTIRMFTQNEADFARSMKKVADIGYKTVQLSAAGKIAPKTIRKICDDNGLEIVLTHTDQERVRTDIQSVIDDHGEMGCRYVGLGSMPDRYRNAEWIRYFAEDYTEPAKALKAAGMRLMYHNHHFEWEKTPDGRTLMEILLDTMSADLMGVTLDTYWVQAAGDDVAAYFAKLKDRLQCVHYKDYAIVKGVPRLDAIGAGHIDFKALTAQLKKQGTTEYVLVEQDDCYGESPFACLKQSYDFITKECAF